MATPDDERYRRQQEEFVSNHGGTTPQEVLFILLSNVCSVVLTMTLLGLFGRNLHRHIRIILEFSLTIVPCIFCCTILSEHLFYVCATMLILSSISIFSIAAKTSSLSQSKAPSYDPKKLAFLTNFRACTNILTAVCILAVDFKVFPRKFAKTEIYGYSLMDTGVGLFIIANALVAPEARERNTFRKNEFLHGMVKSLKNCIPLLMLGFGRFLAIEYLGYQKHVTEYGVHWNFFMTLAFVKIFTSVISKTISSKYSLLSGIWLLMMYEYGLNTKNLKEWILSDGSRDNFISANREGLISIPAYVGLYLIGVSIGKLIHSTYQSMCNNSKLPRVQNVFQIKFFAWNISVAYNQHMILCIKLSLIASQACGVTLFYDSYFLVSRRLANFGYCTWIVTLSSTVLTILLLVEIIVDIFIQNETIPAINGVRTKVNETKHEKLKSRMRIDNNVVSATLEIFEAVNYNGLFFFLFANILTGIINMSIRTLYTDDVSALKILVCYMAVNIISVLVCYRLKVQIKL